MAERFIAEYWGLEASRSRQAFPPSCVFCRHNRLPMIVTQRQTADGFGVEYGGICRECADVVAGCLAGEKQREEAARRAELIAQAAHGDPGEGHEPTIGTCDGCHRGGRYIRRIVRRSPDGWIEVLYGDYCWECVPDDETQPARERGIATGGHGVTDGGPPEAAAGRSS